MCGSGIKILGKYLESNEISIMKMSIVLFIIAFLALSQELTCRGYLIMVVKQINEVEYS